MLILQVSLGMKTKVQEEMVLFLLSCVLLSLFELVALFFIKYNLLYIILLI